MTKAELIRTVAAESGLSLGDASAALEAVQSVITEELARGGRVQLTGFGTFLTKERAEHSGRNLVTGETMQIPAFRAVQFRPGKFLKARVSGAEPGTQPEEAE